MHYDCIEHCNNSFKEKRISLPKSTPSDIQVAFSEKATEQPGVEDVEMSQMIMTYFCLNLMRYLTKFNNHSHVILIDICFVDGQLKWRGH